MTDLQAAVLAVVRDDGSGLDPIPRGVYKALLSSRQCDFLVAKFAICTQPDAKTAQRWADMADITLKRLRKFFDNQRGKACKKRKATSAALALVQEESKVDADEQRQQLHADSLLQLLGEPFAADESADLHAGERAASAVPVVAVVVAAAAAASAAACAAAEADAAAAGASAGPSSASGAASTTAADIGCKLEEYLLEHLPWDEHKSSKAMAPPAAVRVTPRLESFHMWLQSRRIDPFSCARLCPSVQRLALLLERHGHGCIVVSFVFAGACVLRTAFEQCRVNPPASAAAWRTLLADQTTTARVSRLSDSLWYHVRRGGVNFSSCLPTKAREDTLTALAIISAIAPHDSTMHELWRSSIEHLSASNLVSLFDVAPLLGLVPLFSCYSLAFMAALQQTTGTRTLHGPKPFKGVFAIFLRRSHWYRQLCHSGPWLYEWNPPMAQLIRQLSASFLLFACLDNPLLMPDEADIDRAADTLRTLTKRTEWIGLQQTLAQQHARLDALLTPSNTNALAQTLANMARLKSAAAPD